MAAVLRFRTWRGSLITPRIVLLFMGRRRIGPQGRASRSGRLCRPFSFPVLSPQGNLGRFEWLYARSTDGAQTLPGLLRRA